ncbi:hypothetical protein MIND_00665000 [Mycena indigotica]|uniref:Uncharacterized protein n=1 Tax=Mycena indigotica TaxID=2126181 RepID=A0A8H6W6F6_9AGAR|nr:uncharacterized protein MIND_00665000 [Mycena indigotica]KAF7301014.1 hypothetical protein MIND_00665000 [Mycena indigotica]
MAQQPTATLCNDPFSHTHYSFPSPPTPSIGTVGDIYLNTNQTKPALYARLPDGWRIWMGPKGRSDPIVCPQDDKYVLNIALLRGEHGWLPRETLNARMIQPAHILLQQLLKKQALNAKRKPADHAGGDAAKRPRVSDSTLTSISTKTNTSLSTPRNNGTPNTSSISAPPNAKRKPDQTTGHSKRPRLSEPVPAKETSPSPSHSNNYSPPPSVRSPSPSIPALPPPEVTKLKKPSSHPLRDLSAMSRTPSSSTFHPTMTSTPKPLPKRTGSDKKPTEPLPPSTIPTKRSHSKGLEPSPPKKRRVEPDDEDDDILPGEPPSAAKAAEAERRRLCKEALAPFKSRLKHMATLKRPWEGTLAAASALFDREDPIHNTLKLKSWAYADDIGGLALEVGRRIDKVTKTKKSEMREKEPWVDRADSRAIAQQWKVGMWAYCQGFWKEIGTFRSFYEKYKGPKGVEMSTTAWATFRAIEEEARSSADRQQNNGNNAIQAALPKPRPPHSTSMKPKAEPRPSFAIKSAPTDISDKQPTSELPSGHELAPKLTTPPLNVKSPLLPNMHQPVVQEPQEETPIRMQLPQSNEEPERVPSREPSPILEDIRDAPSPGQAVDRETIIPASPAPSLSHALTPPPLSPPLPPIQVKTEPISTFLQSVNAGPKPGQEVVDLTLDSDDEEAPTPKLASLPHPTSSSSRAATSSEPVIPAPLSRPLSPALDDAPNRTSLVSASPATPASNRVTAEPLMRSKPRSKKKPRKLAEFVDQLLENDEMIGIRPAANNNRTLPNLPNDDSEMPLRRSESEKENQEMSKADAQKNPEVQVKRDQEQRPPLLPQPTTSGGRVFIDLSVDSDDEVSSNNHSSAEISGPASTHPLVRPSPSKPDHFYLVASDVDVANEILLRCVDPGSDAANTDWNSVLAHIGLLGVPQNTKHDEELWRQTAPALREYYVQYVAPTTDVPENDTGPIIPQESSALTQSGPKASLAVESAVETLPLEAPDAHVGPLLDPGVCKSTQHPIKLEDISSGILEERMLAMCLTQVCFPPFSQHMIPCVQCWEKRKAEGGKGDAFELPQNASRRQRSNHIRQHHPEVFDLIVENTAGMSDEEQEQWARSFWEDSAE